MRKLWRTSRIKRVPTSTCTYLIGVINFSAACPEVSNLPNFGERYIYTSPFRASIQSGVCSSKTTSYNIIAVVYENGGPEGFDFFFFFDLRARGMRIFLPAIRRQGVRTIDCILVFSYAAAEEFWAS